jgi:hypothetical protein
VHVLVALDVVAVVGDELAVEGRPVDDQSDDDEERVCDQEQAYERDGLERSDLRRRLVPTSSGAPARRPLLLLPGQA